MSVVISCEVGGERIPAQLVDCSRIDPQLPPSSQVPPSSQLPPSSSCDAAARYVAQRMAVQLDARLIANEYSLDLVDVTRSPRHRQLFPPAIRKWPAEDRQRLIDTIYQPYRDRVREALQTALGRWSYVIHLSVRTFALRSGNKILRADMGLLYDPSVDDEVDLCLDWIDVMYDRLPMLRVRRNYPRRGTTDSITKAMRSELAGQPYLGIELMLGRAWAGRPVAIRDEVIDGICSSLREVADHGQSEAA